MIPRLPAPLALGLVLLLSVPLVAQRPPLQPSGVLPELEVLLVQGNVYMVAGAGANVTLQVGSDGVVVVDPGVAERSEQLLGAIARLSKRPVRVVIDTSVELDHMAGNDDIARTGTPLYLAQNSGGVTIPGAGVIGHENGVRLLTQAHSTLAERIWPYDTFFGDLKTLYANGEPIEIQYQPSAHSSADLFVFFRKSDVVSAGDVFTPDRYPMIDLAKGGSVQGVLTALNHLLDLTVPEFNEQGGTRVVPGHGRICNESDVVEYRDMATIVRDRVRDMIKKGMTVAQVQAARPSREYDGVYGASSGPWTTEMFINAVYEDLSRVPKPVTPPRKPSKS